MKCSRLLRLALHGAVGIRHLSMSTNLTQVEVNNVTGIATLTMNRPPVNALSVELLSDLRQSIKEIEQNKSRGLILASANPKVFSAGLDLTILYKPDVEKVRSLLKTLHEVWLALYCSNVPTAAAINGHAPAGGCLLSIACEYRVMMPNYKIGLNETLVGIVPPIFCVINYLHVLTRRDAERALNQGRMFTTEDALQIGLIDEIANNEEETLDKCIKFISTFSKVNSTARFLSKQQAKADDLRKFEKMRKNDVEAFVSCITNAEFQEGLGVYLQNLKTKDTN